MDVDGTLCPVDTLSLLRLRWFLRHPLKWREPRRWRRVSKQEEKCRLWEHVGFAREPIVSSPVRDLVRKHKEMGCRVVVVTGSCEALGEWIARGLDGLVDEIHGSNPGRNLTKSTKAGFLSERFSESTVMYVGDSVDDYEVWRRVHSAGVIDGTRADVDVVRGMVDYVEVVPRPGVLRRLSAWCLLVSSPSISGYVSS